MKEMSLSGIAKLKNQSQQTLFDEKDFPGPGEIYHVGEKNNPLYETVKKIADSHSTTELVEALKRRRSMEEQSQSITSADKAWMAAKKIHNQKKEHFCVLTLDGNSNPIKLNVVSVGLVNRTLVHPRECFIPAIQQNAVGIVIMHNHPSGNTTPSKEDFDVTKRLCEAGGSWEFRLLIILYVERIVTILFGAMD